MTETHVTIDMEIRFGPTDAVVILLDGFLVILEHRFWFPNITVFIEMRSLGRKGIALILNFSCSDICVSLHSIVGKTF